MKIFTQECCVFIILMQRLVQLYERRLYIILMQHTYSSVWLDLYNVKGITFCNMVTSSDVRRIALPRHMNGDYNMWEYEKNIIYSHLFYSLFSFDYTSAIAFQYLLATLHHRRISSTTILLRPHDVIREIYLK